MVFKTAPTLALIIALLPCVAIADPVQPNTAQPVNAISIPTPQRASAHTLSAITEANNAFATAEKTGQITDYRKAFEANTTSDFNFNTEDHVSYDREKYLAAKATVMKDIPAGSSVTWTVKSADKSTVDTSVNAITECTLAASITDTSGLYGAKSLKHQLNTTTTYWEHWIQPNPGGKWMMDDIDVQSSQILVDGKPYKAPASAKDDKLSAKEASAQQNKEVQNAEKSAATAQRRRDQSNRRHKVRTYGGGENVTF